MERAQTQWASLFPQLKYRHLIRGLAGLVVLTLALGSVKLAAYSLLAPDVYRKDYIQDYLGARAILHGIHPYQSIQDLSSLLLAVQPPPPFPHPTPHPPPALVLSMPFALLSYGDSVLAWLLFEMVCMLCAARLVAPVLAAHHPWRTAVLLTVAMLAWPPFGVELALGQLMTVLLVLLAGSWRALRADKPALGGLLLGLMIAIKLAAWPVVLYLLWRKQWRSVVAAGLAVAGANLLSLVVMGAGPVLYYYREVGRIVAPIYQACPGNMALSSLGWRLFEGTTQGPTFCPVASPPLVYAPSAAAILGWAAPCVVLAAGLFMAGRAVHFDTTFSILICTGLLFGPITWSHYLVLFLVPFVILWRQRAALHTPARKLLAFGAVVLLPPFIYSDIHALILLFAESSFAEGATPVVPLVPSLLNYIRTLGVIIPLMLIWRNDRLLRRYLGQGGGAL